MKEMGKNRQGLRVKIKASIHRLYINPVVCATQGDKVARQPREAKWSNPDMAWLTSDRNCTQRAFIQSPLRLILHSSPLSVPPLDASAVIFKNTMACGAPAPLAITPGSLLPPNRQTLHDLFRAIGDGLPHLADYGYHRCPNR